MKLCMDGGGGECDYGCGGGKSAAGCAGRGRLFDGRIFRLSEGKMREWRLQVYGQGMLGEGRAW
jgi:hypothetical protein